MPNLNSWLSDTAAIDAEHRAVLAWRRILDKPTDITTKRLGVAQTVRLEYDESVIEPGSAAGEAAVRRVIVFGVKDHPTVIDTNIRRGDRFVYESVEYQVTDTVRTLGEVQAHAERIS
jgi:hypothetical protein